MIRDAWGVLLSTGVCDGGGVELDDAQVTDFGVAEACFKTTDGVTVAFSLWATVSEGKDHGIYLRPTLSLWAYTEEDSEELWSSEVPERDAFVVMSSKTPVMEAAARVKGFWPAVKKNFPLLAEQFSAAAAASEADELSRACGGPKKKKSVRRC